MQRYPQAAGFLIALAALAQGCGSGERTVWVTGKLVKSGAKYEVSKDQSVQMTFLALEVEGPDGKPVPNSEPYPVEYQADAGTFAVPGRDGYGIPPGKYRVAVTQTMSSDAVARQKGRKRINRDDDLLRDRFSASASPIVRDLKTSSDLTIDLDKPSE